MTVRSLSRRIVVVFGIVLSAAVGLGCENLPIDLGDDVATPIDFRGPMPRWISFAPSGDAIVYELAGQLIVGRGADFKDARALTGRGNYTYPYWSPDGKRLVHAYRKDRFSQDDLWIRPADASDVPKRLTKGFARDFMPVWSNDGRWIAFHSTRNPANHVWIVPAEGGEPEPLAPAKANENSLSWAPTKPLLAYEGGEDIVPDIWVADVETGETRFFAGTRSSEAEPLWRPDGKAIGYRSLSGGKWNVWVREDRDGAEPRQITTVGDVDTFGWLMGGRAVIFRTQDGRLWAQKDEEGAEPTLLLDNVESFAVSPDGTQYVYVRAIETYYRYFTETVPPSFLP